MTTTREPIPPPIIGKAGSYTIFLTPPTTPKPSETTTTTPKNVVVLPPPVQPPPQHFGRSASESPKFGFLRDAVAKVQNAHSNLDEYIANWFGLNQSKYQWALDDYFETNGVIEYQEDPNFFGHPVELSECVLIRRSTSDGMFTVEWIAQGNEDAKAKVMAGKGQSV